MNRNYLSLLALSACIACSREKLPELPAEMMFLTAIKDVRIGTPDTTVRLYTYNQDSTIAHFRYFTGSPGKDTVFQDYFPKYSNGRLTGVEQLYTGQPQKAPCYFFEYENGRPQYFREHVMVHIPTAQTYESTYGTFEYNAQGENLSGFLQRQSIPGSGWQTNMLWDDNNVSEVLQYSLSGGVPTLRRRVILTYGTTVNSVRWLQRDAFLWHLVLSKQEIDYDGILSLNNSLYTRMEYFEPANKLVSTTDVQYFLNEKKLPDYAIFTVKQFDATGQLLSTHQNKRFFIYGNIKRVK